MTKNLSTKRQTNQCSTFQAKKKLICFKIVSAAISISIDWYSQKEFEKMISLLLKTSDYSLSIHIYQELQMFFFLPLHSLISFSPQATRSRRAIVANVTFSWYCGCNITSLTSNAYLRSLLPQSISLVLLLECIINTCLVH